MLCRDKDPIRSAGQSSSSFGVRTSSMMPHGKFKIAVEGNISSGKSTLLDLFNSQAFAETLVEPVDKWRRLGGDNILDRMYQDPVRWSFTFQSYVLLTMLQVHNAEQLKPLSVIERSVYSARYCFVENLHASGVMDDCEYACYTEWFDWVMSSQRPHLDLIVYLRTSPEICYERLQRRARAEEKPVSLEYLTSLHNRYEKWLGENRAWHGNTPVLVLDANKDVASNVNLHGDMIEQITSFLDKKPACTLTPSLGPPSSPQKKKQQQQQQQAVARHPLKEVN